jgi:hypothetical protein
MTEIAIQSGAYIRTLVAVAIALSCSRLVAADPKREAPDYDGRGNTDTEADSWALWIPRVALSPLYVVNEYVVRRPLGGWINATARDRLTWNGGATSLGARVHFNREADLLFFGIGPDVTTATRSRYGLQRFDAGVSFGQQLSRESLLALSSGVRTIAYREGDCCGDPSLDARIADGTLAMPTGYGVNYTTLYQRAELAIDTRTPRPASATGGYLQVHAETDVDVRNDRSWIEYGAILGAAVDLQSRQRTVKVQLAVDFADPLRGDVVPFNELASLGGSLMPGFVTGWMTGRSTVAAQVGYSWPVWMWLDGQARFSMGNAFGGHLDGFMGDKLRMSADLGVTSVGKRDQGFELLLGVGTETLEQGAALIVPFDAAALDAVLARWTRLLTSLAPIRPREPL